jgi:hypothetical protein
MDAVHESHAPAFMDMEDFIEAQDHVAKLPDSGDVILL